jgi:Ca-activated chloride channel family protein
MYYLAQKSIPDVFAARPVVVHGKYRGKAEGKIIVTGYQGKKRFREVYNVSDGSVSKTNRALGYLWARKKIAELDDYKKLFNEDVKAEVVTLGLKYNLLTNYTSFVAVDEAIVNKDGTLKNVKQPLPMPNNVNNSAVGAEAEVKETSKFKRTFTIDFENEIEKNVKRQLTMEFKVMYSKLVTDYLKKYDSLRIKFNADGKVIRVEKLENGSWMIDKTMQLEFEKISLKSVKKEMTLTLKK